MQVGRAIVHWEIRESTTEAEIEVILQRAKEKHPESTPRIISDNGTRTASAAKTVENGSSRRVT